MFVILFLKKNISKKKQVNETTQSKCGCPTVTHETQGDREKKNSYRKLRSARRKVPWGCIKTNTVYANFSPAV